MIDRLRRQIHMACRDLGLDQETRREMQLVITGKASMSQMDDADGKALLEGLKARGFKPGLKASSKPRYAPASRPDLRLIHVLWRQLGLAGVLRDPTRKGLNTFIRRRFGPSWEFVPRDIDDLREKACIDDVIRALKDWCERSGIALDQSRFQR